MKVSAPIPTWSRLLLATCFSATQIVVASPGHAQTAIAAPSAPSANASLTGTNSGVLMGGAAPSAPLKNGAAAPKQIAGQTSQNKTGTSFTMSEVERVRLRVWGYADLTGEYLIDSDLTISLPGIGRINVGHLTTSEFEKLLSEKLTNFTRRDVTVAVEVARFQPYYIMGHIGEAGANEWRPGLNVVQAIAIARGVRRPDEEPASDRDGTRQLARDQARMQLQYAMAQLARLKAEKDGSPGVSIPDRLQALILTSTANQQMQIRAFIAQQNSALTEQRALQQSQLEGLERDLSAARAELAATEAQAARMTEQIEISRTLLRDITELKDKQLIANSRYLQQRSDLIANEVRLTETRSLIERARSRVVGLETSLDRLNQERRNSINERMELLEREIAQLEISQSDDPTGGALRDAPVSLSYQIARPHEAGMKTFTANVFSEVRPGDVIIISSLPPTTGVQGPRNMEQATPDATQRALEAAAVSRPASARGSSREGGRTR